ncbi:MAG: gamma-glutamyltransferase [Gaiellaceae bacterium]|jgi:gamma-glutamyltranspeptidase/glutathione hydrolase
MRGAIAAGHPLTAEAGARVLVEGGSAVDACIAASFASWVTESMLSGPGAGGFFLVHDAVSARTRLADFFVCEPGLGSGEREFAAMEQVDVAFEPDSSQAFSIGAASCAVPGATKGLEDVHRRFGRLPWRELAAPAIELARRGVEITPAQDFLHQILDPILRHNAEGRRIYELEGRRYQIGDLLRLPDLARTLEQIAADGAAALYGGELGRRLAEFMQDAGGKITFEDIERYRVIWRRPVRSSYRGCEYVSNPPPSSGGILVAYGLQLLGELGEGGAVGSPEALARLVEVMREQTRARSARGYSTALRRGGLATRLLSNDSVREAVARVRQSTPGEREPGRPTGTTHISVVDAHGNAASLTCSLGSSSGVIVPGTGIHMNNMLGEEDLVMGGEKSGERLTSMMAPSIVLEQERPRLVLGSAGSVRLRGAIMQTVVNVIGHGLPVEEAVNRARVHLDEPLVQCEGGDEVDAETLDRLETLGYELVRWRARNVFFGGVSAVELRPDGALSAAGDPRRGGHGLVVA